jgi:two-component system, chemotaxis family, chemotaxis protein CheY
MINYICLLCVDDDPTVLHIYEEELAKEGYIVVTAEGVGSGLTKLVKHDYDLVITDMQMPRLTGLDFLKSIRQFDESKGRHTPVLLVAGIPLIQNYLEKGFDDVLGKPFKIPNLKQKIRKLLQKE